MCAFNIYSQGPSSIVWSLTEALTRIVSMSTAQDSGENAKDYDIKNTEHMLP